MKNQKLENQICKDFASLLYLNEKSDISTTIYNLYSEYYDEVINDDDSMFKSLSLTYYKEIISNLLKKFSITNEEITLNQCKSLFDDGIIIITTEEECNFFDNYINTEKRIYYGLNKYIIQHPPLCL